MLFEIKNIRFLSVLASCLILVACHSSKKQKADARQITNESSFVATALKNNLDFVWLKGRFDGAVNLGNESITFGASLRMKKDSVIWISISKLGFNVVKVVLTQDTVVFIDKIQGKYYAGNYSFFRDSLKTEIDFAQFQSILTGNFNPYYKNAQYYTYKVDSGYYYCTLNEEPLNRIMSAGTAYKGQEQINVVCMKMDTSRVERVYYQDPIKQFILDIVYKSRQDGDFPFPKQTMVELKSNGNTTKKLDLEFSKIETGIVPLDVQIVIPNDYVPIK